MIVLGIFLIIAGLVSTLHGNSLNNSIETHLKQLLENGATHPGNTWICIGIIAGIIGIILLILGLMSSKN